MKIHSLKADRGETLRLASDVAVISHIASDKDKRPCAGCRLACACSQSPSCTCGCSARCSHLTRKLSSDPDRFPLESGITPLVYTINSFRVLTPCWSCEGHTNDAGALIKLPSVWFYSSSAGLPRLLVEYSNHLYGYHEIKHEWGVEILAFGDAMQTTYALRPNLSLTEGARLTDLRDDILCLADTLFSGVQSLARERAMELDRELAND